MTKATRRTFGLAMLVFILPFAPAHAEGDAPFYSSYSNQDYENNYSTYKTNNQGVSTNFVNELVPLGTFGNDGRLKFESRSVDTTGSSATRFDEAGTGLQLDFKF